MRMTRLLLHTLRDDPTDAEVEGHSLLVRGGYVRRVASGVYTYLPLGWRVLSKIEHIVRQELDAVGMQEMLMPALSPIELWDQSGRSALFGQDALPAFVIEGRGGRFVLGPTHEEVATVTVASQVDSYRQLPVTIYQIQSKFRDEARPRFGLLRTRELIMCDAYSFDKDARSMHRSYDEAVAAYLRIFNRIGLDVTPVEARSGAIGGDVNHEFMVRSVIGEDKFVRCPRCNYASNVEAAEAAEPDRLDEDVTAPDTQSSTDAPPTRLCHTPGCTTIESLVEFFADPSAHAAGTGVVAQGDSGITAGDILKCVAMLNSASEPVVVMVPGNKEARVPLGWRLFEEADFERFNSLIRGYIGPMGLEGKGIRLVADWSVRTRSGPWVTGANRGDHHVLGVMGDRDFVVDEWGSYATVQHGDPCPRCATSLELVSSVEAAHTFQLGTTYSSKMPGGSFLSDDGSQQPFYMGCYGIGISRLMAVIAEENHDENGLVWPAQVAPFQVHLLSIGAQRSEDIRNASDSVYAALKAIGAEVLYDDRELSGGIKFKDSDLVGIPLRLVVGQKGVSRGVIEWRSRRGGLSGEVSLEAPEAGLGDLLTSKEL